MEDKENIEEKIHSGIKDESGIGNSVIIPMKGEIYDISHKCNKKIHKKRWKPE
jgi:hypothetical protein